MTKRFIIDYDFVKRYIEVDSNSGCKLLSTEYVDRNKQLDMICKCGNSFKKTFNIFYYKKSQWCKECGYAKLRKEKAHSYEYVKNFIENKSKCKLLSKSYKNSKSKLKVLCSCKNEFEITFNNIQSLKIIRCPKCIKEEWFVENMGFTYDYVKDYIENISNSGCELISKEYISASDDIEIRCCCGTPYKTSFNKFKNANRRSCLDCLGIMRWDINLVKDFVTNNSKAKLLSQEYKSISEALDFACECGKHYSTSFAKFKGRNQRQCPECGTKISSEKQRLSYDYVKEYIEEKTNLQLISDSYESSKKDLSVLCYCGQIFSASFDKIRNNPNTRCDECGGNMSSMEYSVYVHLKENNVYFKREVSFDDCRNIHPLPFDFVIYNNKDMTDIKLCIEVQGQQHYRPVNFGGISDDEALESFEKCKMRDVIKKNYCKNNNIKLIEIPYWEFDNLKSKIQSILK